VRWPALSEAFRRAERPFVRRGFFDEDQAEPIKAESRVISCPPTAATRPRRG
jgi:hypothetical protein